MAFGSNTQNKQNWKHVNTAAIAFTANNEFIQSIPSPSQSVGFMKFFSSDCFSFLIYWSNMSIRGKVDADLQASLSPGWDQSECCFSLM